MKKIYNYSIEKVVPVHVEPKVEYKRRMQWFEFRKVNAWDVIKVVANHFGVSVQDIQSPSRKQEFVQPRMYFAYLMRQDVGVSYANIGGFLNRDHCSILHYMRVLYGQMTYHVRVEDTVDELREKLLTIYCRMN